LLKSIVDTLIAFGPIGVCLLGFVDSLGVPLPAAIDALLLAVAIETPQRAYFAALMAVVGSAGGNIALFYLARHGSRRFINTDPPAGKQQKFQRWFQRYGLLTVFIPAVVPFVPLPLKVFVISAGALHTPFGKFILVVVLARVIRYFGEAYLGIQLGQNAQAFLQNNAWTLVAVAIVAAAALHLLIRWNGRRRPAM
jgi:membrane protein DedA with SNARE-associated domain